MAAKLLHSLADDNQDLQKQIGCMTGIFQLFDRNQMLTARRISQKRLPSGNLHFSDGSLERDSDSMQHRPMETDTSLNRGLNEKQRLSTESSRASFSSCSSSVSSLDFKAEVETSYETPSRETFMNQPTISPRFGRHSLDLRDVVKDSMYRDPRGPSGKSMAKEQSTIHAMKHRDSPRPLQMSKYVDRSYGVEIDEKQSVPIDLKESIRVLSKLRDAPWHYAESTRENPRSSQEVKDGHWHSISKDAPWLAYDGRETSRLSFESRETIRSAPKLKEFPRHSLDSKEGSWRTYSSEAKPNHLSRNVYGATSTSNEKISSPQQSSSSSQSRPPSVVAKLMGLEAIPDSSFAVDTQPGSTETYSAQDNGQFPRASKNGFIRPLRVSNSPKISLKDPTSPRRKNSEVVMKPVSSSKFPLEPAPWKQHDANRNSQKQSLRTTKAPLRTLDSSPSVYSEIEKRLKDLEFKQSGRDLRALKQILEAMQEKGLLESRKEEQVPNVVGSRSDYEPKATNLNQNFRSVKQQNPQRNNFLSSTVKGNDSARAFDSPIVIMKPAKLVEKSEISATSAIPMGGFSGPNNRNNISSTLTAKEQSSKNIRRDASPVSTDKKTSITKPTRSPQSQSRSQQFPKENNQSSMKNSGSVSPRLQQKKLELERRSRVPTPPPSDSNKSRRQSGKKAASESASPGRKVHHKILNSQQSEEQLSEISNDSRSFCQDDEVSLQSDSVTFDSKLDIEVTSNLRSSEIDDSQSPSLKAIKQLISETVQKKSTPRLDEDETISEFATKAPEHPSPTSVLDGSVYKDDEPSQKRQTPKDLKVGNAQESRDNEVKDQWKSDGDLSFNSTGSGEINRKKLQSIDHLVQKLRRLSKWHCTNTTNSTCTSSSDICKLPRSSWSWDTHPSNTIISHWNLECASTFITGLPQSSFFIGCLLGSFFLAALADSSIGRKNMLIFSCVSMSITSMLIIFSTNVWIYSAMKFLIGFWRSSIGTCVLVLLTEKVSAEWRFRVGIVEYFTFTMGYMSLPGFAYINRNSSWKSLYIWSSVPAICYSVIAYLFVTESPRWLVMQGREKEILKMLKRVSSEESADDDSVNLASNLPILPPKEKVSFFQLYSSIGELFHKRWAVIRMIAVMILGIGLGMVYFGMPLAVGNLGFNIYLAVVFSASMELPSCVATYFLENLRRKPSILVFSILGGICCVMCAVLENRVPAAKVVLAMVAFFGACTAYNVFLIYIIELFPTCVRNTTTSLVRQAIVFGCIFCPFLISAGRKNNIYSYGVFGVVIMLSNFTLFFLPETMGIVLCDTMDQQEKKEIAMSDAMNQDEKSRNVSV